MLSLSHRGRFLALAMTEIIELRAARAALLFYLYLRNPGGMNREDALNALTVRNAPDGKILIEAASLPPDYNAGENLDSLFVALDHPSVDPYAIAHFEFGNVSFLLLFLNRVDNRIHNDLFPAGRAFIFSRLTGKSKREVASLSSFYL